MNAERSPRADALRNRARVLAAAEEVFGAAGPSASTEEVARRAGVGIGTVFRHFPTKEALLEALIEERLRRMAERARDLAGAPDAGEALATLLGDAVGQAATKIAVMDALTAAGVDVHGTLARAGTEVTGALAELLARAQRDGAARPDLRVGDLIALLAGASRAAEQVRWEPAATARVLAVILAGLRPPGDQPR